MINIDQSSFFPSMESFQYYVPLTSTPKRSTKSSSKPLSSTLSISNHSDIKIDLSISAITSIKKTFIHQKKHRRSSYRRRRRTHIHSSTIIKRIELKDLLYSTRAMKHQDTKQRYYTDNEMKIYLV